MRNIVEQGQISGSSDTIVLSGFSAASRWTRWISVPTAMVAPAGSVIGVGTEIHLVQRLAAEHPDRTVVSLDPLVCPCSTMFRIDAAHLAWVLENLVEGTVVNQIKVDGETAEWARVALERMLAIT